jgi:hypothetical protein
MALDRLGYQPEPGQEGTIKDLLALRRMQVALRTNIELARGWAQREKGLRTITATPAWEFLRVMPAQAPRDWEARWQLVDGHVTPDGRMIERKDSVVWEDLGAKRNFDDALDVDHPPFAWGSGMGWRGVGFREAKDLGLLEGWSPPPPPPVRSPNESLQTRPRVTEPALREALAEKMGALAEWQGDVFLFTDPNGTRRMPAAELAQVWRRPMPEPFRKLRGAGLMQKDSLRKWVEDHRLFSWKEDTPAALKPGNRDEYHDLLRCFWRLPPMAGNQTLWRGVRWHSHEQFNNFLSGLERTGFYVPYRYKPADSWSVAISGARKHAAGKRFRIMLVCEQHRSARDISALVRSIEAELRSPSPAHPPVTDGEAVFLQGTRFRVRKVVVESNTPEGGRATVYVEEA